MMRMETKPTGVSHANGDGEWEMRPGGMLVQKRAESGRENGPGVPVIRVRVKFGSVYHQVNISSQATFGELKKMLSGPTGLHHEDQKLLFKDKERDSKAFLDIVGVKDRSKIVLIEDPISQEKRYIEMRKNAKMEKASRSISEISLEVDRLAGQVSNLETIMSRGGKIAEKDVLSLTELLMNQLLKLDGIIVDGDVKLQRKKQVSRVQKFVETLDMLKIKNTTSTSNGTKTPRQQTPTQQQLQTPPRYSNGHISSPNQHQQPQNSALPLPNQTRAQQDRPIRHSPSGSVVITTQNSVLPLPNQTRAQQDRPIRHSPSGSVVITTQWETFDVAPTMVLPTSTVHQNFNWDLL